MDAPKPSPGPTETADGTSDGAWLAQAIELACQGAACGAGGPFGAVVVRNGQRLGAGHNQVVGDRDPTAHAEVVALRRACAAQGHFHLEGAVLYASCEPCPMCLAAAYWAHIERIVYAATREDAARCGFDDALIYRELARPASERCIPLVRRPSPEAQRPFECWQAQADRVRY